MHPFQEDEGEYNSDSSGPGTGCDGYDGLSGGFSDLRMGYDEYEECFGDFPDIDDDRIRELAIDRAERMASRHGTLDLTNARGQHVISLHNGHEYFVEDLLLSPASELFCKGPRCKRICSVVEFFRALGWAVLPNARVAQVRTADEGDCDDYDDDSDSKNGDDETRPQRLALPAELAALVGDDASDVGSIMDMLDGLEDWQNLPRIVGGSLGNQKVRLENGQTCTVACIAATNIYQERDGKPQHRHRSKKPLQPVIVGQLFPGQQVIVDTTCASARRFPGMVRIASPLRGLLAMSSIQAVTLKIGDVVHVISAVCTANNKPHNLAVGNSGVVLMVDADGDARIDFGKNGLHWIHWWHFHALELTSYTKEAADLRAAALVTYARNGDLEAVRHELAKHSGDTKMLTAVVNTAKTWTESEEKYGGYTKSWTWYGDTALIAAARLGHDRIVEALLQTAVCDPSLESCPSCDAYETALQAAARSGRGCSYLGQRDTPGLERCKQLLLIAEACWPKAPYSSSHAGTRHNFTNVIGCPVNDFRTKLGSMPPLCIGPSEKVVGIVPALIGKDCDLLAGLKPCAKLDRLLFQAATYSGPDSTFEPVGEAVGMEGVGPDAVRKFLLRGANPTLKHVIHVSRIEHRGQCSHKGPKLALTAVEVAAEAKATLRRYIGRFFDGSSTRFEWEYICKADMRDEAEQLLMEEVWLGESVALLEAAACVWERHAKSGPCNILTTHRIGSPGCLCPLTVEVKSDCRFTLKEMDELRTAVASVPAASPVDDAHLEKLASAMLVIAAACRAKHLASEQKRQEVKAIEDKARRQKQEEQREVRRRAREEEERTHLEVHGDPKVCRVCLKRLKTIDGCMQHMRTVHGGV